METRARYALIGLFMLAVILASFAFVYWLENKGGFTQRETYQIRFDGSVSGLLVGSAVLFNGIRVGEVTGLSLNPNEPQQVVATIGVVRNTPISTDTQIGIESQGLTGGAAVTLRGGTATAPVTPGEEGGPPVLIAQPGASRDWTQAARDAFQQVDTILSDNAEALRNSISNIDTFTDALARNSDKVDGILAGLERLTGGGGTSPAEIPIFNLVAATHVPPPPAQAPTWQLVIPEPTTLMGFNTDKILLQPAAGESTQLPDARWSDNVPILFQEKVIQTFENAGYAESVGRTRDDMTGNYRLLLDIRRFHIATGSTSTADVAFMAKVIDLDGKIVGARLFEASSPASGSDAQAYVSALDEAFGKLQSELLEWTIQLLDSVPVPPVSVEPPPDQPVPDHPLL